LTSVDTASAAGTTQRATTQRAGAGLRVALLLVAFAAAVALRVAVGGSNVTQSLSAALAFAGCLLGLALAAGTRVNLTVVRAGALLPGVACGLLICLPVALAQLMGRSPLHDTAGFWPWALVVAVVASAEELFLRGSLYDAVRGLAGIPAAVGVGAIAFGLLHVPLYGWHILPLDVAVGVVLGMLRASTGTVAAPAIAHIVADYGGWFLR
jgi:membrane protease YdiL (CAAX protease family)